jgi:hypothetical protein
VSTEGETSYFEQLRAASTRPPIEITSEDEAGYFELLRVAIANAREWGAIGIDQKGCLKSALEFARGSTVDAYFADRARRRLEEEEKAVSAPATSSLEDETREMVAEDRAKAEHGECVCQELEYSPLGGRDIYFRYTSTHPWSTEPDNSPCLLHHDVAECLDCAWHIEKGADKERLERIEKRLLIAYTFAEGTMPNFADATAAGEDDEGAA